MDFLVKTFSVVALIGSCLLIVLLLIYVGILFLPFFV